MPVSSITTRILYDFPIYLLGCGGTKMRDPARIEPIIEALKEAWKKNPDLRLCQLITVAAAYEKVIGPSPVFYTEDDVILAGLKRI